jgi:hypothetical protein
MCWSTPLKKQVDSFGSVAKGRTMEWGLIIPVYNLKISFLIKKKLDDGDIAFR